MKSTEINELITALASAQAEFSAIPKTSENPFFKSKYAGLPEVVSQTTPILSKHGLVVTQFVDMDESGNDLLTTYLTHTSGQFISHSARLHLVKSDPQAHGSAITYMRRYSYMAALGLVADEDDDGNSASAPVRQSSAKPAPRQENNLADKVASAAGGNNRMATENMTRMIWAVSHSGLGWDDSQMFDSVETVTGRRVEKLSELSFGEAKALIEHLKALQDN
jgi:ERF superfamily